MNNAELYCIEKVRNEGDFHYSIIKRKESEYVLIIDDKNADIPGELSSKDVYFSYSETEKTLSFKINNKEWVMK